MAVQVGELFHKLTLDDKDFKKGMKGAESNASKLAGMLKNGLASAAKIGAAGITATSAALLKATKDATNYADEIDKTSQKMGLNYEQTQKWNYVASQMGTNLKSLERGLGRFQKNVNDAAEGTGTAADAIETLGIDVTDANGNLKDMNQLFPETIQKMQGMEDTTKRNALAMELFGRGGKDLIPILNSTSGSVDELMQRAEDLGIVMDKKGIQQGVKLTDTVDDLSKAYDGLKRMIGVELIPVMQGFADYMLSNLPLIRKEVSNLIEKAKGLSDNFIAVANTGKLVYDVLKLAFESVADVLTQAVFGVMTLVEAYKFLSNSVKLAMKQVGLDVAKMIDFTIQQLGKLRNAPGMNWAGDLADDSASALTGIESNIASLQGKVSGGMAQIKGNALALGDFFKESGGRVKDNLDAIMKDFDAFGNSFDINEILTGGDDKIKPFELGEGLEAGESGGEGNATKEDLSVPSDFYTDYYMDQMNNQEEVTDNLENELSQRQQIEETYADKWFNMTHDKEDQLRRQKKKAIQNAKETGANIADIEKVYNMKIFQHQLEQWEKEQQLRDEKEQAKLDFEEKWRQKLFKQQATKLELLQAEKEAELANAEEKEASKAEIKMFYDNLIAEEKKRIDEEEMAREKAKFGFLQDSFETYFETIMKGSKSTTDAFKELWSNVIDHVIKKLAKMAASKAFSFITGGGGGGLLGGLDFGGIFHDGGTVPGPIGQERMILAQAGETISPIGSNMGSGGGGYKSANIYLNIDGRQVAQAVKQPLVDSIRITGGARF